MNTIWFTSDTHFGHNREFIYKPRGFNSIWEHDKEIIKRWNEVVSPEDDIFHLGDVMLGDNNYGISCVKQLKGNIHIIRGNHCTDTRMKIYNQCYNIVEITEGKFFRWDGYYFYLSHYPTITSNLEKGLELKRHVLNLYGHTHQQTKFYNEIPYMYNVGVDAHNCYPISIEDIIKDIQNEVTKCIKLL